MNIRSQRSLLIIVILNLTIQLQGLQLRKIENNPGILPVKQGQAFKEKDKWTIVKILDFKGIDEDLAFNIIKYKELSDLINNHKLYMHEFKNMELQVEYLRNSTVDKIRQLMPQKRFKRGLIDPLGSMIKILTGNLAHEDAVNYDNQISQLKMGQTHLDKKITIISEMLDSITNKTGTLQENIVILDERMKHIENVIKNLATKENNSIYSTYILSMFDMFLSNFRTIYIVLSEIETALSFTKVSVLHQSIIDPFELLTLLSNISKTESLIYPVTENNLVMLERTMSIKAYVKENHITFIIEIPLTDSNIYNYYKIYSLPIFDDNTNKTTAIIPKYPYLIVKSSMYLPLAGPCEEITANQFLCKEDDVILFPESTCIEQLMNFASNLSLCKPLVVYLENLKIQPIDSYSWIIYIRNEIILTETCSEDVTRKSVKGTYILEMNENCSIHLENIKLHRRHISGKIQYKGTPITVLPTLKETSIDWTKTTNLKNLNLDDLKHLSFTLKSEMVESDSAVKTKSVSLATVLLYVILVLTCLGIIISKNMSRIFQGPRNHRNPNIADNFALAEGGVMETPPIQIVRMSA